MNKHSGNTIHRACHLAMVATLLLVALLPTSSNAQIKIIDGAEFNLSVAFSPDGSTLACGTGFGDEDIGYGGDIRMYDVATGERLRTLEAHNEWVHSIVFSPDGSTLASGGYDNTVRLWNSETGEELHTFEGHSDYVYSVAFSPDGSTLASGSKDETVRLWNVQTGTYLRTLEEHTDRARSVAFSPDGSTLVCGTGSGDAEIGYGGDIRLYDVVTGARLRTFEGHTNWVESVAFSPDGTTIASGSLDNTVRLWNAQTGAHLRTLEEHTDRARSVTFSPDGSTLAWGTGFGDETIGYKGDIHLYDVVTGVHLRTLEGHTDWVESVAFSPDGTTIASGSSDDTIRLWTLTLETVETTPSQPEPGETTDSTMFIYWTQALEGIQRATLDGADEQNAIATGLLSFAYDVVFDAAGGRIYWTVLLPDEDVVKIQRANVDGSDVQDIFVGLVEPGEIALDSAGGKLYWTDSALGKIRRANLDGSEVEDVIAEADAPSSVVLDTAGGKLYWTDPELRKIRRANLDGTEVEDLVTSEGLSAPFDIALDAAGGKMYWSHIELDIVTDALMGGKIQRANLDGTEVENLLDMGAGVPWDIALDIAGGKMYWSYLEWDADADIPFSNGKIQRANLDGTEVEDIVTEMLFPSFGIALGIPPQLPPGEKDVVAADIEPPRVTGGTVKDGDGDVDPAVINADGKIEVVFSEEVSGNITLQTEFGDDVGWIGNVEGNKATLEVVARKEIDNETTYVIKGEVFDAAGNSTDISITFVTKVLQLDSGDTLETATALSLDTPHTEDIFPDGDVDYFSIQVDQPGELTFHIHVTGDLETVSELQDSSGARIVYHNVVLSPGTYYVKVRGGFGGPTGTYTVYATLEPRQIDSDSGDTLETATALSLDTPHTEDISPGGDVDYFSIQLDLVGELTIYTTGDLDTVGELQDSSGAGIAENDDGGTGLNFRIVYDVLSPGTYYVKIESFEGATGSYTVYMGFAGLSVDVNGDGMVDLLDLIKIGENYGQTGENDADANGDGVVDVVDLVLVAGALEVDLPAAPSVFTPAVTTLNATDVQKWLADARRLTLTDSTLQRGVLFLEHLLMILTPQETVLLPNYPNPFNPETWIPYQLTHDADVSLAIYDTNGAMVRLINLGHQPAGFYTERSRAAYWDGRNDSGETVASGVYFYRLRAGDYSHLRRMVIVK